MRTRIATAALTIMFLSAGAFAHTATAPTSPVPAQLTPASLQNVTVIFKNQAWPRADQIVASDDPCSLARCYDI